MTNIQESLKFSLPEAVAGEPRYAAVIVMANHCASVLDDIVAARDTVDAELYSSEDFARMARLFMSYLDALHLTPKAMAALEPKEGKQDDDAELSPLEQLRRERAERPGA